jgi:formyltetrahydrofolate deformylase
LLAHGPLREGVAAALTGFVYGHRFTIVAHDQYVDHQRRRYYTRLAWQLDGVSLSREQTAAALEDALAPFELWTELTFSDVVPRVAVFVSNLSHCLYDILGRWRSGEWRVEVPLVVSNHASLSDVARRFETEFAHVPITTRNKVEQERREIALLREKRIDLVVLARYMQVLGPEIVGAFPDRIINIHHAFLPAFPGAKPYHAAYVRGVKIIGATSHYVTADLDAGPIIEQDVIRVSHATPVEEMIRRGRDLEATVLARAVWMHLERRVIVDGGRTIIFG